jgi:ABC-2 type transport system ATP-binding protein
MIEAENLTAGYGAKSVLHDVTFSFTGGATGLLGPNGAGKSTLIKTVLGLIPPMSGRIDVLGKRLPRAAAEVRSRIGYMPETEAFIPGMNAVQFTAYMGQLSGLPRAAAMERAHEVLQYVGLGESRYRNLETYSTGMKQRAKLAQAIVHDPTLLLLDEPTNGMDPPGRAEMLELVADLSRNKGMSVVLCSHLLHDVETVANEIIVMGNGRIAAKRMKLADTGDRDRIYSVRVRGSREDFVSALQNLGIPATNLEDGANLLFKLSAGSPTHMFFKAAAQSGCVVQRLEEQTEKLEDLFVKTMGELGHAHL